MPTPITPEQVAAKSTPIPDVVIDVFNRLIVLKFRDGEAHILQDLLVEQIVDAGIRRNDIFDLHYLDVDPIFDAAGWDVAYFKPAYNSVDKAYFTFTPKKKESA